MNINLLTQTIGSRVKTIREDKGFTQKTFGKRISVGQTYLSQIENDEKILTEKLNKLICYEFNVNSDWLKYGTGNMYNDITTNLDSRFKNIISGDDELHKKLLISIINLNSDEVLAFVKATDCISKILTDLKSIEINNKK